MLGYPKETHGIHKFSIQGKRFVYDRETATPFVVDSATWDVLELAGHLDRRQIVSSLTTTYAPTELESVLSSLDTLEDEGDLFSRAGTEDQPDGQVPLGAMVLQVAHDCNLRCRYCYAASGTYGGTAGMMDRNVGERAIDFFLENSADAQTLNVTFFGGEPLLNFGLVKHLVEYAGSRRGPKEFKFTITTNGVLLTVDILRFLSDNRFDLIVSLDGPVDIHDATRVFPGGGGSQAIVLENARRAMTLPIADRTTVRGTFTNRELDLSRQVDYLFDQGFANVSVEPAIGGNDNLFAVRDNNVPEVKRAYEAVAESCLRRLRSGAEPLFFHFRRVLEALERGELRKHACRAGAGYIDVSPNGDIYPCHMLDGTEGWKIGSVFTGFDEGSRVVWRTTASVDSSDTCRDCWAKYLCGGRCRAHSALFARDLAEPLSVACKLVKCRIEAAIWLQSECGGEDIEEIAQTL